MVIDSQYDIKIVYTGTVVITILLMTACVSVNVTVNAVNRRLTNRTINIILLYYLFTFICDPKNILTFFILNCIDHTLIQKRI